MIIYAQQTLHTMTCVYISLTVLFSILRQLSTQVGDQQTEINKLRHIARMYGADTTEIVSAQVLSKTTPSATKTGLKHMMASIIHLNTKIAT